MGECFSEPPGFSQPAFFEPIARSMAAPTGRGEGTIKDDLYALGVTAAILLQGQDPTANLSADVVWARKMSQGSFVTLVGDFRISGPTDKLLRGLLCDDPDKRWGLDEARDWLGGQGTRLTHAPVAVRSAKPLKINNKNVLFDRLVAQELGQIGDAAFEFLKNDRLVGWVRDGLKDRDRARQINEMIADADAESGGNDAKYLLVTRICLCLDPLGPIRFRGQSIHRDGIGAALVIAMCSADLSAQTVLGDLLRSGVLNTGSSRRQAGDNVLSFEDDFSQMQQYMENSAPGFGLERCLYELNTASPCLSPLIAETGAVNLADLLMALDKVIAKSGPGVEMPDRHVAAFFAARSVDGAKVMPRLALPDIDPAERRLAVLGLFAAIQDVSDCGPLLDLADWMVGRMNPVLDLFESRTRREQLNSEVTVAASLGNLVSMYRILGSTQSRAEDRAGLQIAKKEYANLSENLARLEDGGDAKNDETRELGKNVAKFIGMGAIILSIWFTFFVGL